MLEVCEELLTDLEYVAYTIKPCFPPEFNVMKLHIECYEKTVMGRINSYMDGMDECVKTEPQAVLTFNKFVQTCADEGACCSYTCAV